MEYIELLDGIVAGERHDRILVEDGQQEVDPVVDLLPLMYQKYLELFFMCIERVTKCS